MTTFAYEARDKSGRIVRGTLEAADQQTAYRQLRETGLIVRSITMGVKSSTEAPSSRTLFAPRVKLKDLAIFSKQFSAMVDSGIDILRCLQILERQTTNPTFKQIIGKMRADVASGLSLSQALSAHPRVFSPLYIALVRAGEEAGALDVVLARLAIALEKEINLRNHISAAMKYPQVIAIVAFIIVTLIMIFIVPVFINMFDQLGAKLPLMTRILAGIAYAVKDYWYIWIPALIALIVGIRIGGNTPAGKIFLDRLKLRLPVFGSLLHRIILARFSRNLATLIANGVPALRALEIVDKTAGNHVYELAIRGVRESVAEGESISLPMESFKLFPPMVTAMIAIGEETGALDSMLNKIADFYEAEVEAQVKALTSMIEPILIVVMGVIVGFIVISIFLPLFGLIRAVQEMR